MFIFRGHHLEVSMQPTLTEKQQRVLDYLQHEIATTRTGSQPAPGGHGYRGQSCRHRPNSSERWRKKVI